MEYQFDPSLKLICPVCLCQGRKAKRLNRVCVGVTVYTSQSNPEAWNHNPDFFGVASVCINDEDKEPRVCCSWDEDRLTRAEADAVVFEMTPDKINEMIDERKAKPASYHHEPYD